MFMNLPVRHTPYAPRQMAGNLYTSAQAAVYMRYFNLDLDLPIRKMGHQTSP